MNFRSLDLANLNTATKYPSILTYHGLGERGALLEDGGVSFDEDVVVSEKIDGTNTRIIVAPDGEFIIGSREELLHARGDLIHNPALGIVDAVRAMAERLAAQRRDPDFIVVYGEVYGGRVTAASQQYTGERAFSFRLFDVCAVSREVIDRERAAISSWRDQGGQAFVDENALALFSEEAGIPLAPRIRATPPPKSIEDTFAWLKETLPVSLSTIDDGAKGEAEGVVVRSPTRSRIAKIRFQDYARHTRRQQKRKP
ncbi:MAG: RNA ligase family protein [Myxococcota bacterium]